MIQKPFSESCIQNQAVILEQLNHYFKAKGDVLEIGAGTGQHAVHFAAHNPQLNWYPSDRSMHLSGMQLWFDEAQLSNIKTPVAFDVTEPLQQPKQKFNYIFTANTLHIMSRHEVELLFQYVGKHLKENGRFMVYGPFNYNGQYTSESNQRFDVWLSQLAGDSSIKHFEDILGLAELNGLDLLKDVAMPANNRILVLQKKA